MRITMDRLIIKSITGQPIEVDDLDAAIEQCENCADSPYRMPSGHTVGEDYAYMLAQLKPMQQERNRRRLGTTTAAVLQSGGRLTRMKLADAIGRCDPNHAVTVLWPDMSRRDLLSVFNEMFGTKAR